MTKPLSPTAQAVLDAMYEDNAELAAAVLEAAADQVVPKETVPKMMSGPDLERKVQRLHTRRQLLAIAAELKTL